MKFTVSTKPLKTALGLTVVNKNINKNIQKSMVLQISASDKQLVLNTEAAAIKTQVSVYGTGDNATSSIIVDALQMKNLISTIDANQVTLEFYDNFVSIVNGSSFYRIAKVLDTSMASLSTPMAVAGDGKEISKADWQFIAAHQMFALPHDTTAYPVYNNVWVGENGDVIAGDMTQSIFAHSGKSNLGAQYLLSDSIINLLCSVPDGSKIAKGDDDAYSISYESDSIKYLAEFLPAVEGPVSGDYKSSTILPLLSAANKPYAEIGIADIGKVLSQLKIVSAGDTKIHMNVSSESVSFSGNNISTSISASGNLTDAAEGNFKIAHLASIVSAMPGSSVKLSKAMNKDKCVGLVFSSDELTVVCAWCK